MPTSPVLLLPLLAVAAPAGAVQPIGPNHAPSAALSGPFATPINDIGFVNAVTPIAAEPTVRNLPADPNLIASPAPEPAAWALMIAGFGLVGWALRRRRPLPRPAC